MTTPMSTVALGWQRRWNEEVNAAMSEEELALQIEEMFNLGGWQFYHPYKGEKANTILDYIAWRERLIHIELKTQYGRLTKDRFKDGHFIKGQITLIPELIDADQEVYIFRPSDRDAAQRLLIEEPRRRERCGGLTLESFARALTAHRKR